MKIAFVLLLVIVFVTESMALGPSTIIGIDYGTDSYKVMVLNGNAPDIVLNDQSGRRTANLVGFANDGQRVFGSEAKQLRTKFPSRVISGAHLFLGKSFPDEGIEATRYLYPFELVNNNGTYGFSIDEEIFSPEEIVAMVLQSAQKMAISYTGRTKLEDTVIMIPPYLTQSQRIGFINAAQIARMNVLTLAHEGISTAVQYLRTRLLSVEETNQETIFYNVGAAHSSASLVRYNFEKLKNGTITRKVLSNVTHWEDVGGRDFDERLASHIMDTAEKETGEDLRSRARVKQRILGQAKKAKEVLSANKETRVRMESLVNDRDFSMKITRKEFDSLCEDLFDRAVSPVKRIMDSVDADRVENIDIEVVGGGSRTLKIDEFLHNLFGEGKVGRHLNGDESPLMGAMILAATTSAGKVSSIVVRDTYNRGVAVNFGIEETDPSILFKPTSRVNGYRNKNVYTNKEFNIQLYYGDDETPVPTENFLGSYEISDFPDWETINLVESEELPTVKVRFELDRSGVIDCVEAQLRIEEYVPSSTPKPTKIIENENNEEDEVPLDNEVPETEETGEEEEIIHEENEEEVNSDLEAEEEIEEVEDVVEEPKTRKRIIHLDVTKQPHPLELNRTQISKSKMLLSRLAREDKKRLQLAETKNALESYIYSSMDFLWEDGVDEVSTEEEREQFKNDLQDTEDWLYDGGLEATLEEFQEKLQKLSEVGQRIALRLSEKKTRREVSSDFQEWRLKTLESLRIYYETKNVAEVEMENLKTEVANAESWFEEKQIEQSQKQDYEDPAWTTKDLIELMTPISDTLKKLGRRRARTPTPTPIVIDTEEEILNEEATINSTDTEEEIVIETNEEDSIPEDNDNINIEEEETIEEEIIDEKDEL